MKHIIKASIIATTITLSACTNTIRPNDLEIYAISPGQHELAPTPEAINNPQWRLNVLSGGFSTHLTTKYQPAQGYNEYHRTIGLQVEQTGDGMIGGIQAMTFTDSFDKRSNLIAGTYGLRKTFNNKIFTYGGIAIGYIKTSYYEGPLILPLVELGYSRIGLQVSYLPETQRNDAVLAGLIKFNLLEFNSQKDKK